MFKGLPVIGTPFALKFTRLSLKLVAGLVLITFFLNFQPTFATFPPVKKNIVLAQDEQSQQVQPAQVPFVFQLPHSGYLSTFFSAWHPGIDIATGLGMPIKPIAEGTVSDTGFGFFGYGTYVEIDHGKGYKSFYAHLGKVYVQKGQQITEGTSLGEVGLTGRTSGPHTHLEVIKDGKKIDPVTILPSIRKYPETQDFVAQGSTSTQSSKPKSYVGGPTKLPTLGAKSTPTPTAVPTPKPVSEPTVVDKIDLNQILTSTNQISKPDFLSL